ncbi:MAG: two-component system sensor histidine kinase CreC [Candidatus Thiodiazotropha sp. (ex Gloverina cf. vestifex)]|nr:two-component system sensor histidine kinase CreC [Candidatus Thiodiazotropha sp. (ex Gloverina cf. vestifex)]
MNLSVRIFLGYFLLIGFAVWFVMRTFTAELVPGMRQSLEEVLVDTANLVAELVTQEMMAGRVTDGEFAEAMKAFARRRFDARIWFLKKRDPNLIVYITDAQGIVRYDSRGRDLGSDYSRWNDVYKTLRGQYGARTTREDPQDEYSSIMYVAAPITQAGRIIGVVTVGKPSVTVQPFVERAINNMEEKGGLVFLGAVALGLLITYWLTFSIRKLTSYARAVRDGKRVDVPSLREKELAQLAEAMEAMRSELEGKDYVENYLHSMTHELKSPLASIQGTAELLNEEMPLADRQKFIANIRSEAHRLHQVVEQLLGLAGLEKRRGLEQPEPINTTDLLKKVCEERQWAAQQKGLRFEYESCDEAVVTGERFLLQQALGNLIDNAIDFSPRDGTIFLRCQVRDKIWSCSICDQGPGVPDYAVDKVFERFYSLPRPGGGRRSSGLGLSFVQEVAQLHGGQILLENREGDGVMVRFVLPLFQQPVGVR